MNRLTEKLIGNAKPGDRPRKLADGAGLYLLLNPSGSRYWRFRYRFAGKHKMLSLGVYPAVSLEQARATRDQFHSLLADGINPSELRKAEKAQAWREADRLSAVRFSLDSDGALSVLLPRRRFGLTPNETFELRDFLDATKSVPCKETSPCPS